MFLDLDVLVGQCIRILLRQIAKITIFFKTLLFTENWKISKYYYGIFWPQVIGIKYINLNKFSSVTFVENKLNGKK